MDAAPSVFGLPNSPLDSMNMSLSNLWELEMNREAWHAAPHDIAKSGHD